MRIKQLLLVGIAMMSLISCQKEVEHYMRLSTKNISVSADGATVTFDVTADVVYRVNNDCDFATITDTQTIGDVTTFTLKIDENVTEDAKKSQIRFIGDHVTPLKLVVEQRGFVPYGVSETAFNVDAAATSVKFTILGEKAWTASVDNPSFKLSQTSGETGTDVIVTFPENTGEDNADAVVTVMINGETFTVTISQKSLFYTGVDPQEISVSYSATEASFTISTQKDWTVTSDNASFVPTPASGTGNATVTVNFPENTKEEVKTAKLTVKIAEKTFEVNITQAAAPKKDYVDLSAKGTANCYIVPQAGYYKFNAKVRGNGTVPATLSGKFGALEPASVIALWSTTNDVQAPLAPDAFIKYLELEDGYVRFFVPETVTGNMSIAALDADGKIIWSWHIWFTQTPQNIEGGSFTWMDRNLGAVTTAKEGQFAAPGSAGFFFSWGRKDPMRPLGSYEETAYGDIQFIGTSLYNGYEWGANTTEKAVYLIERMIAEPTKYYEDAGKFWVAEDGTTKLTDLWNDAAKTMFDPCPAGYRIPSKDQFTTLATDAGIATTAKKSSSTDYTDNYSADNHYFKFGKVIFTLGGAYTFNNNGNVVNGGIDGRYCSSTYNTSTNCYWINVNATAYNVNNSGACTQGGMVRCVKE